MHLDPSTYVIAGINLTFAYVYLALAFVFAGWIVYKSDSPFKLELLFVSFFILSGDYSDLLTFKIPGISFFEIQPERFLLFLFLFFIIRKYVFTNRSLFNNANWSYPWFYISMYLYVGWLVIAQFAHVAQISAPEVIVNTMKVVNFLVIIFCFRVMFSRTTIDILAKSIILGAIMTSLVAIVQIGVDPTFIKIGEVRKAFGPLYRATGAFDMEYFHSYFVLVAMMWVMITIQNKQVKTILLGLFAVGVFISFQRMSWLNLALIFALFFLVIERMALDRLLLFTLCGMALLLVVGIYFQREIMNSSLVQDRLAEDNLDGRAGYYTMVFNEIGKKPIFGYGGNQNPTYYKYMLRITRDRQRASGETGDIHNGYLQNLFYFGIPTLVFFLFFVLLTPIYFLRLIPHNKFFYIPFFIAFLYVIINFTNSILFSNSAYFIVLLAIHIGIGLGARYSDIYYPQQKMKLAS